MVKVPVLHLSINIDAAGTSAPYQCRKLSADKNVGGDAHNWELSPRHAADVVGISEVIQLRLIHATGTPYSPYSPYSSEVPF